MEVLEWENMIMTLSEEDFDMTPIDFDMGDSNILDNKNKRKKSITQNIFEQCNRPNENKIKEFCEKLNMKRSQIKTWFQNRRSHLKDELRKENATLREKIHVIHQALNRAFLTSQHVQIYTGIGTSDPSLLNAVNGPSSLFNVLESGISSYSTTIPIIPQENAP
ncbi:hypothetical protein QJS10_CPB21g01266 [Acorus calamus]|uniref:Homeobox domain-containing protein n=1 Tax=Acorus calamus TaxID=4465 RepID=A0AAV9C5G3_ACOCL|nr:hypothetical protein QJS10_CPB21g01266 [Acorus calamus]